MKYCLYLLLLTCLNLQAQDSPFFANYPALSPDGNTLIFAYNGDLWRVATKGGTALRLTALDGRESHPRVSPAGKWIAFSGRQSGNADVYLMPFAGGAIQQLTHHAGSDQVANWAWDSRSVYFVSNRYNRGTTFTVSIDGGTPARLFNNYFNTIHNPAPHPNGKQLYFNESWESSSFTDRKGYKGPYNPEIKSFNLAAGTVSVHTDWEGKDLWPTIDRQGTVYFTSDHANGEYNLYQMAADGHSEPTALTETDRNIRGLAMAPDSTHLAFPSGRDRVEMIDLDNRQTQTLATDEIWGMQNDLPRWSPDSRYLMFTAYRNFERDIILVDTKNGNHTTNLTKTGVSETEPVWSPDGKYIFFTSSRFQPVYPRGHAERHLFRLPLTKANKPFRQEKFDELFQDDIEEKEEKAVVTIDARQIMERVEPFAQSGGSQFGLATGQDDDRTYVIYGSNHEGQRNLYLSSYEPFEKVATQQLKSSNVNSAEDLVTANGKHYLLGRGQLQQLKLSQAKAEPIETKFTFRRALRPEFEQMFYETWANLKENFYDENFHGQDWDALRDRYAAYLPYLTNRQDLRRLTNDLLGELNTSHYGFRSMGEEEQTRTNLTSLSLGLIFQPDAPYTIASILADGPADRSDLDIRPGDRITAINGAPIDPNANRETYFTQPSTDEELALTLVQSDGQEKTARLHPETFHSEKTHRYDAWVDDNQERVDEASNKRVA